MTSMKSFSIPIPEMRERRQEVEKKFIKIAQHQINEEDAQLIVEGCLAILFHLGEGARERLEKRLGVPVLEGSGIAVKTLEMLVNLKLTHSKRTYPSPLIE
jgi:Asp/Glu/hydantoin racemase